LSPLVISVLAYPKLQSSQLFALHQRIAKAYSKEHLDPVVEHWVHWIDPTFLQLIMLSDLRATHPIIKMVKCLNIPLSSLPTFTIPFLSSDQ
jgi:hypothetical protein